LVTTIEEKINEKGLLNAAVRSALRVPIPQNKLLSRKGPGGTTLTYTSTDYLEERLTAVDPDWQVDFRDAGNGAIVCAIRLLGVQRSALAGYLIPKEMTYYDTETRTRKTRPTTTEDAHTIVTKAQAAAFRRACAMFGPGAELWPDKTRDAQDDVPDRKPTQPTRAEQAGALAEANKNNGHNDLGPRGQGFATEAQIKFLRDVFFVPPLVARELTSGSNGTTSLLINYMKERQADSKAFEDEAPGYLRDALFHGFTAKNRAGESIKVPPHQHLVKFVTQSGPVPIPAAYADEDDDAD